MAKAENGRYAEKDPGEFVGYGESCVHIKWDQTLMGIKDHEDVKPGTTNSQPSGHQKNYRGEKPHVFSECGKAVSWKAQLVRHQRSESREKRHSCDECGTTSVTKIQLTEHQRTHKREAP